MSSSVEFGVLLPHFGSHADRETLCNAAVLAEETGFDGLWARDHLIYHPHGLEDPDQTFVEQFTTLSGMATITEEIALGTAVTIPLRHPLVLAQLYSSLSFMSERKIIAGIGLGNDEREFEGVNVPYDKRPEVHRETIDILRKIWTEEDVSYDGDIYSFEEIEIFPQPVDEISIWGGGSTPASVRRSVDYCDGWLPGRIPLRTFEAAVNGLERRANEQGRETPESGAVPIVSVGDSKEEALSKVDVDALLESANGYKGEYWKKPESGRFETVEDIRGLLLAGTPAEIAADIEGYAEAGVDHLVFDLRLRFDDLEESIEILGDEVIPEFQ